MGKKNVIGKINLLDSNNHVRIKTFSIKNNTDEKTYNFCDIRLDAKDLKEYIQEIQNYYLSEKENIFNAKAIEKYNSYNTYDKICYLKSTDMLVCKHLDKIEKAISSADKDGGASKYDSGLAIIADGIKLFSLSKPYRVYKHIFSFDKEKYKKCDEKFLVMPHAFDLMLLEDELYLLNSKAEKMFDFDRSYKNKSKTKIKKLKQYQIIDDIKYFEKISLKGHNPKKYYHFDDNKIRALSLNSATMKKVAERLPVNISKGNKQFVIKDDEKAAERLIKFFCGQVARDLLEDIAIEVPYIQPLE